jgi:hypothetical protein
MPEVGPGPGQERFSLVANEDVFCVVDIVDHQTASILLEALPDFPLEVDPDIARRFVAAWRQRANMESLAYEVRDDQIGL